VESANVTTPQRIQIRKVLQKVGVSAKQGEELAHVPSFLQKVSELADKAGGEAPKPERPDTRFLDDIRLTTGNEQLLALYNRREELVQSIGHWERLAEQIQQRWPSWMVLKRLVNHASGLPDAEVYRAQVDTIEQQRQLLEEPDPINPLITSLTQSLREALNTLNQDYQGRHEQGMKRLEADGNWQQLEPEQRNQLLSEQKLTLADQPKVAVQSTDEVLNTLDQCSLAMFADRVAALPSRFDNVAVAAAELCEPEIQFVSVPRRTLKTEADIDAWAEEVKDQLKTALEKGPISVQ
jgi:hypothetical protein